MSEVRQDLERATQGVWPAHPGALDRQHRRQRRRTLVRRTSVFALVSFLAIALAVLLGSQWSRPSKEPVGTPTIPANASQPTLVMIDVATGRISRVMGHVSPSTRAGLSPDGSRVAFSRVFKGVEQLYVADPSGTVARLTGPGRGGCGCGAFDPTWSPDGTRIAFSGVRMDGNQDIYVVDVSSGTLHRLTRSLAIEGTPTWSPDGRTIAFSRGGSDKVSLWSLNAEGGPARLVTRVGGELPAWSPDGRTIAFGGPAAGSGNGLWIVHPDGSGLRRAVPNSVETDGNLSWSPDGRSIAFAAIRSSGRPPFVDVDVISLGTGSVRVVATGLDYPTWDPDGRTILALRP